MEQWIEQHVLATVVIGSVLLILIAAVAYTITLRLVLRVLDRIIQRTDTHWDDVMRRRRVFQRLSHFAPALVIYYGVDLVPGAPDLLVDLVQRVAIAVIIVVGVAALGGFLTSVNDIYSEHPEAQSRPIKGYIQIAKIVLYVITAVVVIAQLLDRSPLLFFSGIGAMTAVLLLIFRDTILSLVASLQLAGNDMVRVGDWIQMPQYGVDGDVIDIALHTVKVQNFDKTISTIPTHKLIEESFKNWRGMEEAGGRRIKRAINIDVHTVRFLTDDDIDRFSRFEVLGDYIRRKVQELKEHNARVGDPDIVANARKLTNLGTFRAYVAGYLRNHPDVRDDMTFLIRHLEPGPEGIPVQVYVFSGDTRWPVYESIQADIFDHILAVIPEFGLEVFQKPSGYDFRRLGRVREGTAAGE